MAEALLTVGHGTASQAEFTALLGAAGVTRLVDVRRYPGSRAHPHVGRDALAEWLPTIGVDYRWEPRLGGRRRVPADSPDRWWRVAAFRGYAAHMRTPEFVAAVDDLLAGAVLAAPSAASAAPSAAGSRESRMVILCSESLWWRCHRRLVADFVVGVRGVEVCHLDHRGKLTAHEMAAGARLTPEGTLVYDRD
ncbi:DUF488 family protein [Micromonospora krabiensis]|uniref:DUF488 domain-containing protein n=1 Tax=Micromonospora krabiensis TaxID=307121 RepID=A0A1C3N135_9ACTN|nr:DUF488 domain-containing protein [Micromonospora krabiensis]SBV26313.1 Protein of unknown function, DUF488 [Micromonospora krabiensis]